MKSKSRRKFNGLMTSPIPEIKLHELIIKNGQSLPIFFEYEINSAILKSKEKSLFKILRICAALEEPPS